MQIRCNFPDISYLSETQKNNFQFLNKRQTNGLLATIFNKTFSLCIKLHICWNTDAVIVFITKN